MHSLIETYLVFLTRIADEATLSKQVSGEIPQYYVETGRSYHGVGIMVA